MSSRQRLAPSSQNKSFIDTDGRNGQRKSWRFKRNKRQNQKWSFEWSLKPLTIWAALMGFDLGLYPKGRLPTFHRFLILVLGFVLFLSNLWVNVEVLGYAYWLRLFKRNTSDPVIFIKVMSAFTADGILFTGLPLIFFAFSLFGSRWNQVRKQIFYIQKWTKPGPDYRQGTPRHVPRAPEKVRHKRLQKDPAQRAPKSHQSLGMA